MREAIWREPYVGQTMGIEEGKELEVNDVQQVANNLVIR
jgi:hypothetical protein